MRKVADETAKASFEMLNVLSLDPANSAQGTQRGTRGRRCTSHYLPTPQLPDLKQTWPLLGRRQWQ